MEFVNKNDKQVNFNSIKGFLEELNEGDIFSNLTLKVGHENTRLVNLVLKKNQYDYVKTNFKLGDKVDCRFYITSKNKNNKWYTMANILSVNHCEKV